MIKNEFTREMKRLVNLIENKIVCVLGCGRSLEILENKIEELKDLNLSWIGMNDCEEIEKRIMSKIDKNFDIVFNFSFPVSKSMIAYINNILLKGRVFITKKRFISKIKINKGKVIVMESVVNRKVKFSDFFNIHHPNSSLCSIIIFLLYCNAKKIILFGCDGIHPKAMAAYHPMEEIGDTYYLPEIKRRKKDSHGLCGDVAEMNKNFLKTLSLHRNLFKLDNINIINCTPYNYYTCFKRINYRDLMKELK